MSGSRDAVLRRRIFTQRLAGRKLPEPEDVVRLLAAVQSQEYAHGFWSVGIRQLGLDDRTQQVTGDLVVEMLEGDTYLTRKEIGAELERHGIATSGERLAYIVMSAELRGLICSGPMRGAQHTYAVLDQRVTAWRSMARPCGSTLPRRSPEK